MAKKIFNKRTLAILLTLVMLVNGFQLTASAAGANGVRDESGRWTYAYYLGQEYLGNAAGAAVKPDPVGYGFQGVITSITFTDDAGTSWTFNWSSVANGEWRITGSNVSQSSASAWPQITDGKVYIGYCGDKAYTFTLGNEGSSESWTYANTQNRHANWFRYIRFIREYTVNVFYQNETGTLAYNGEYFAAADPAVGSFQFLYPDGGIIDDSEFEDGEYTEPTTLLPAEFLPQALIEQGYELKYATDAAGNDVMNTGVTISLLGDNVLNVYCTLIPPKTENYTVVHEYYTEGSFDGSNNGSDIEVTEGSDFAQIAAGIQKLPTYNGNTYAYIRYTVDPVEKVITLTYSRDLPTYDYTVIYDANFGANETKADSENAVGVKETSKTVTVDANTFTRENYYFAGWNTARNGSGTAYAADDLIALTAANNSQTLYAQWQEYPKYDYIVTYNANFGTNTVKSDEENISQTYAASYSVKVNENMFSRPNYTFLGWATEANGEVIYQAGAKIAFEKGGSEELFAVWQEYPKYDYTVTYNANFGTNETEADEENTSQTYAASYSVKVNENMFSRPNYTFLGWATEANGEVVYKAGAKIAFEKGGSEELFAVWQEYPKYDYTVTYNANFGDNETKADDENSIQVYDTSKTITVDGNPFTRENHDFVGWATEPDGEPVYKPGDKLTFTNGGSEELFAVWQEHPKHNYALSYNGNGGLLSNGQTVYADEENISDIYNIVYSIEVNKNTFVRKHYDFIGWNTEPDGSSIGYSTEDLVPLTAQDNTEILYAQWREHPKYDYTVIYNANFGETPVLKTDEENAVQIYDTSKSITVNENSFVREHYTFIGWATEADGEVVYQAGSEISFSCGGTEELFAVWQEHPKYDYTVKYNANYGLFPATELDEENIAQTYATFYSIAVNDKLFNRANYTFIGWSETKNGNVIYNAGDLISFTNGGEKTLYAQWIEHNKYSYTVVYNGNGGELTDGTLAYSDSENIAETYAVSHTVKVDDNTFSREHYDFIGWNTEPDGSGIGYSAEDLVALTSRDNTETLYAQWQEHPKYDYTVIYNANFGTNETKADEENALQVYATAKNFTVNKNSFVREHYTFIGWATEADGEVVYQPTDQISFVNGGSEELFAVWQEHDKYDYAVTYNANFGDNEIKADEENISQTYAISYSIEVNENTFVRANYTFIGWSESADGAIAYNAGDTILFTEGGEKTLYAQWIEHDKYSYAVVYNGNGGELTDGTLAYGDSENAAETYATSHTVDVDSNAFTREHHTFAGWNTAADGTGTAYAVEDVIALTAEDNTETLYAQWTLDNATYTVEYKVQIDDEPYEDFTGELPEDAPTGGEVPYGTEPEIVPPASIEDDTYTYDFTDMEIVGDKIIVYYTFITPKPEIIEIPDEDVPLAPTPEVEEDPIEEGDIVDIFDEEVPLADVPKTGDATVLYAVLTALSGMGLAALGLKKKAENEK